MARRRWTPNELSESEIAQFLDGLQQGRKSLLMVTELYDFGTPEYKEATALVLRLVKMAQDVSGDSQALLPPTAKH